MNYIKYTRGYKYQLVENYECYVSIKLPVAVNSEFITLWEDGKIQVRDGYAWDGPSGPTIDTKNFMRGSLVHDALYQLMREGLLPRTYRDVVDRLLQTMCYEDGMSRLRAWAVYQGVKFGGADAVIKHKDLLVAP